MESHKIPWFQSPPTRTCRRQYLVPQLNPTTLWMLRVVARTNNPVLTMLNWQTIGVSLIRRKSSAHAAHGGEKKVNSPPFPHVPSMESSTELWTIQWGSNIVDKPDASILIDIIYILNSMWSHPDMKPSTSKQKTIESASPARGSCFALPPGSISELPMWHCYAGLWSKWLLQRPLLKFLSSSKHVVSLLPRESHDYKVGPPSSIAKLTNRTPTTVGL